MQFFCPSYEANHDGDVGGHSDLLWVTHSVSNPSQTVLLSVLFCRFDWFDICAEQSLHDVASPDWSPWGWDDRGLMVFIIISILTNIKIENQCNEVDKKFKSIVTLVELIAFQLIFTCHIPIMTRAAPLRWECDFVIYVSTKYGYQ